MYHVQSTRAQQHENKRLSLRLSFLAVGPAPPRNAAEVPLMDRTIVELSDETKMCPRKPSASGSHPKGEVS